MDKFLLPSVGAGSVQGSDKSSTSEMSSNEEYDSDTEMQSGASLGQKRKRKAKPHSSSKKCIKRLYRKEWELLPELKGWLAPSDKDSSKAKCKYCKSELFAKLDQLKQHCKTEKHRKCIDDEKQNAVLPHITTFAKPYVSEEQKIAELRIASFIAQNSIAFRQSDGFINLIHAIVKKDTVAKNIKVGRTKCTRLVTQVLGPGFRKLILEDLSDGKYSLLIDETTDVSTMPMLCLVLRYVSYRRKILVTTFYRLLCLDGKNAESITTAIVSALKEDGLRVENLVGLGTDGANVLVGKHSGVFARLKEFQPELVVIQCICHSLHNAAKYAFEKLPGHLEGLVRNVYGYFCLSSSRKARYAKLYQEINGSVPKKLLKLHGVRWLSLFQCVDALLKQWDELIQFFENEKKDGDSDQRYRAREVYQMLSDEQNKVYLSFCRWFLKPFAEKNLLFQSDNADVNELDIFYVSMLRKIVVMKQLENFRHSNADILEFEFEKYLCHLNMVDFGIDFYEKINNISMQNQEIIKQRCQDCLIEAARQVRNRLPKSLNTLRLLESLSPLQVVCNRTENIIPLLQRFRSLSGDIELAYDEFRSLTLFYTQANIEKNVVDFWLNVYDNKDAAGNSRFHNIAKFALNMFSLPFSNAYVERVFSAMALVKTNLRNRLICDTVDSVLAVRYGLKFLGVSAAELNPTKDMLKAFNSDIYATADVAQTSADNDVCVFDDIYSALEAIDGME